MNNDSLVRRVQECLKLTRVLQDDVLRHVLQDVLLRLGTEPQDRDATLAAARGEASFHRDRTIFLEKDTDRLNWLESRARAQLQGTADRIAEFMDRGATLREAIDAERGI